MRFLGLFNKEIAETVEMMYEWTNPYVVDTSKAEKAFGLKPTLLKQAMKEMLVGIKQNWYSGAVFTGVNDDGWQFQRHAHRPRSDSIPNRRSFDKFAAVWGFGM